MKLYSLFSLLILPCALFAKTDRIIYYHIPKNGGTTATTFINNQFDDKDILTRNMQHQIKNISLSELSQYKFIRGHFLFSRFKGLSGKRVTFLREPIARIFSAHRYFHQHFKKNNIMSRNHIYPLGDPLKVMSNNQCKFLSSLNIYDPTISDKKHLKSAKHNLEHHFFFVGITEDMDNGLPILCSKLGLKTPTIVPRQNTTQKPQHPYPQKLIQKVKERNWADMELYSFAKELYERKYKRSN